MPASTRSFRRPQPDPSWGGRKRGNAGEVEKKEGEEEQKKEGEWKRKIRTLARRA